MAPRGSPRLRSKLDDWKYGEVDGTSNDSNGIAVELVGFNKDVLELGCTAGHVTKAMRRQGCRVIGVEVDPEAAVQAREYADDVLVCDLEELEWVDKLRPGQFDVVLAGDVLERLADPLRVLQACRALLKPDGELVVSLANIAHADIRLSLLQGEFAYRPFGLLDESHLRFFTVASGAQMLRRAGFLPIELRRVVVPVFESELRVDRTAVGEEVLATVMADIEAETYQMVFRAALDNGDESLRGLADRCRQLDEELRQERAANAVLRAQLSSTEAERSAAVAEIDAQRAELESQLAAAQVAADVERCRAEQAENLAERILQIRTLRVLAPARRLYASLFRR
jgi:2-polyprenyl-3-methyl-5-hydroxy-6-metoxy-1,4-benzoquinol methylase